MILTTEQKLAFTVFGMLLANEPQMFLEDMSSKELVALCHEVDKYISPHITDGMDLVTPSVQVLKTLIKQLKG